MLGASCGGGVRGDNRTFVTKNSDGETLICHQEYPTGSHIGRTVCRTQRQIDEERLKSRELVNRPVATLPERPRPSTGP